MTHWLYPVNPTNQETWGYKTSPTGVMADKKGPRQWHLPQRFKDFAKGDLIWVRESKHPGNPQALVIGVGVASTGVQEDENGYFFKVVFGTDLSRHLAANPFALEVESTPMAARKVKASEKSQLESVVFDFAVTRLVDEAL